MKKVFWKKIGIDFEKIEKIIYILNHLVVFYIFFVEYYFKQASSEGLALLIVPFHPLESLLIIFFYKLFNLSLSNPFRFLENFMDKNTFNQWFGFIWEGHGTFTITNILFMLLGYFLWFNLIIPLSKRIDKFFKVSTIFGLVFLCRFYLLFFFLFFLLFLFLMPFFLFIFNGNNF